MVRYPGLTDAVSLGVILVLLAGIAKRRDRKIHPRIMRLAFVVDLGLVLFLELTRGAVERASEFSSSLLAIHVAIAVLTLVANVILIWSGSKILKGEEQRRGFHFKLAWVFMVLRVSTFLTAFLIPAR